MMEGVPACLLNALNQNCDIVGMANFAPMINTRGCIFTYPEGIVCRGTYYVFYLYTDYMGDIVRQAQCLDMEKPAVCNHKEEVETVDSRIFV